MRPNGGLQEDGCPQGMLVWEAGPRGCWRGAGEVWVLLGARWAFREGARVGGNLQPRSGSPVHAPLRGRALGLCHQLPAASRTARLAGGCVRGVSHLLGCGLSRINTRGCRQSQRHQLLPFNTGFGTSSGQDAGLAKRRWSWSKKREPFAAKRPGSSRASYFKLIKSCGRAPEELWKHKQS